MKRYNYLIVSMGLVLSIVLSACAPTPTPEPQVVEKEVTRVVPVVTTVTQQVVVAATPEPKVQMPTEKQMGGTLNIWLPSWPEKSWIHRNQWESGWATNPMRDPLFFMTPDGPEGILATGYEVSADGLTYTFHLREGVKWHDGAPFTVEDVVYTLYMFYHPNKVPRDDMRCFKEVEGLVAYNKGERDDIPGLVTVDDFTFQMKLDTMNVGFWGCFGERMFEAPMPKHIVSALDQEQVLNGTAAYWTTNPVGTGPYKFVKYETDRYIEYERNDDYWGGPVGPERLFMLQASADVAQVMFEKGELHFVNPLAPTDALRLAEKPGLEVLEAPAFGWYGLTPNYYAHNGFWQNPKAKQAFMYSIDIEAYVDSVMQGYGFARYSFFDGTPYACPTLTKYAYDPEKADALWTELIGDKTARIEREIDLMGWPGIKARLLFLPVAQEYLRAMGFKCSVDMLDNLVRTEYRMGGGRPGKDWDFEVVAYGPGVEPGGVCPNLLPDAANNPGPYRWPEEPNPATGKKDNAWIFDVPRITEICQLQVKETDFEKRKALLQELDCLWNEHLPWIPVASPATLAGKSQYLQGVDWEQNAFDWSKMYKLGDWWVWGP